MDRYEDYLKKIVDLIRNTQIYVGKTKSENWETGFGAIVDCFQVVRSENKAVFFIGNGGSAAIADHMTADFMKNGKMRTVGIINNALTTCMGNDYGYEYVYEKPLELLMKEGDLLVAISSSGNSPNIVNAVNMARKKEGRVITFSGFREDNRIRSMGNYNLYVPIEHYGMVESIHQLFLQQIADVMSDSM